MGNEKLREALEWALSQASLYPRQVDYMRWECRFCGVEAQKVQGIAMEHSPECPYGKARAALAAEPPEQGTKTQELRELKRLMENDHGYRLWSYETILGYVNERIAALTPPATSSCKEAAVEPERGSIATIPSTASTSNGPSYDPWAPPATEQPQCCCNASWLGLSIDDCPIHGPKAKQPSASQFDALACLIERNGLCLGFCDYKWRWLAFTDERALRFARRSDAIRFIEVMQEQLGLHDVFVNEHSWAAGKREGPHGQ